MIKCLSKFNLWVLIMKQLYLVIILSFFFTNFIYSTTPEFDSNCTPAGLNIETLYDSEKRPIKIIKKNRLGQVIGLQDIRWDANSRKTQETYSIDGQRSISTIWIYDADGKLDEIIEGWETENPKHTKYFYNVIGSLSQIQKADGVKLFYEYNQLGELARLHSSDLTIDYLYFYDKSYDLTCIKDQILHTETNRSISSAGLLLQETQGNGLSTSRKYDSFNRLTHLILPDHSYVEYEYKDNYLNRIKRKTNFEAEYTHSYEERNSLGHVVKEKLAGDLGEQFRTYNSEGYLENKTSPYWSENIVYDPKTTQIAYLDIKSASGHSTKEFYYDENLQLTHEISHDRTDTFTYDWLGNRISHNDKPSIYNNLLQLVDHENTPHIYDANGNLIETYLNNHPVHLSYDALDRLIELRDEEFTYKYTYDSFHRRLSKVCMQSDGTTLWEKFYLYNGLNEIGVVENNNIVELRMLGEGLGGEVGAAVAIEMGQKTYIPIHDYRGSVCCLIDLQSKEIVETITYTAFGEEFSENKISPWRFSGKRADEESGLIFFGKRYYNPTHGRWLTPDPLGHIEGPNTYIYASNNPINRIDPYGLFSFSTLWQDICEGTFALKTRVFDFFETINSFIHEHLSFDYNFRNYIEDPLVSIFGKIPLGFYGFYQDEQEIGTIGQGEVNEKARVTFINGILNARHDIIETIETISKFHGDNNIHYVFRPTEGWTKDVLKSVLVKFGWVSPQAKQLAELWRKLIEEMGGIEGGGHIIHYAHSIGGSDTGMAKNLLSPEEQRMIQVYTMGSPTLLKSGGFHTVVNYVSLGDGVCYLDPVTYHKARNDPSYNVTFLDNSSSMPLVDHQLNFAAYNGVLEALGRQFLETYVR